MDLAPSSRGTPGNAIAISPPDREGRNRDSGTLLSLAVPIKTEWSFCNSLEHALLHPCCDEKRGSFPCPVQLTSPRVSRGSSKFLRGMKRPTGGSADLESPPWRSSNSLPPYADQKSRNFLSNLTLPFLGLGFLSGMPHRARSKNSASHLRCRLGSRGL